MEHRDTRRGLDDHAVHSLEHLHGVLCDFPIPEDRVYRTAHHLSQDQYMDYLRLFAKSFGLLDCIS